MRETTVEFDGYGRPWRTHKPEWLWFTGTWPLEKRYATTTYNLDDSVATVTDPRGVETAYTYGGPSSTEKRPLVSNIVYAAPTPNPTPGASPDPYYIPPTPPVSFEYDAAGNRKKMIDGTGTLEYSYDALSRLITEEKEFIGQQAPQGTFSLTYEYYLSGGVKSITGPHNFNVTYSVDQIGRTTAVENTVTNAEYLSNISYRSFGAMKSMNIATASPIDVEMTYDDALRPSTYYAHNSVGGTPVTIQKAEYSYGNDGKVKEIDNQRNGPSYTAFDQRNVYDFAGRLKKNAMGANDYTFNQTLGYDAFNNLTSRDNYFYAFFDNYSTPNNKRDKAGNVVEHVSIGVTNQLPEPGGGSPYTDTKTWNYDAAGRMAYWHEHGPWGDDVEDRKGETLFYDGDGRPVGKYVSLGFEYYSLVSSVTGKRVIDVVASGSTSEPFGVQVYLGDTLIYDQTYRGENDGDFVYGLGYRLTDPITGSLQQIFADGTIPSQETFPYARTELAGLGTAIPLEAPPTFPEIDYSSGGFPGNAATGCVMDGLETAPGTCNDFLKLGWAAQCPDNNCNPKQVIYNGKQVWTTVRYYADGYIGHVPRNAKYAGNGLVEPLLPSVVGRIRRLDTDLSKLNGADNEDDLAFAGIDWTLFADLVRVYRALGKPDCRGLFAPTIDPRKLLVETIGLSRISRSDLGAPVVRNGSTYTLRAETAPEYSYESIKLNDGSPGVRNNGVNSSTITLNSNSAGGFDAYDADSRMRALIHELGHAANQIHGAGSSQILDDNATTLAGQSVSNQQLVAEKCR